MIRRFVAVLIAVIFPLMLGAAKCEEQDTHPSAPRVPNVRDTPPRKPEPTVPDPHAGDPQPSGKKERIITIIAGTVEKAYLPARVVVFARGATPSTIDDVLTTSHTVTYTLTYDANAPGDVIVSVVVTPSRAGSQHGSCSIEAGTAGRDPARFIAGGHSVQCVLTIKRPR